MINSKTLQGTNWRGEGLSKHQANSEWIILLRLASASSNYCFCYYLHRVLVSSSSSTQRLEDHITVDQFSQLMDTFHSQGKHRKSQGTIKLTTESFRTALSHTLNKPVGDERITLLCNKVRNKQKSNY